MVVEAAGRRRRRKHSDEFKAQVILACRQPGVSMASVALAHGLNATMLRKWVVQAEGAGPTRAALTTTAPAFVPVSAPPPVQEIRIAIERGHTRITVTWPSDASAACAGWLRELLR